MDETRDQRTPACDEYIRNYECLSPQQIVQIAANRVNIEQAKGVLMFIYDVDADTAYELLRAKARSIRSSLRDMCHQLMFDLRALTPDERLDLQSACDRLLISVHERIASRSEGVAGGGAC